MNKSLALHFWPILYNSIVKTPEVSLKLNLILLKLKTSKKLFYRISFCIVIIVIFGNFISRGSVATQLKCGGIFSNTLLQIFHKMCR